MKQRPEPEGELRCQQTLGLCWQPMLLILEKLLQQVADEANI